MQIDFLFKVLNPIKKLSQRFSFNLKKTCFITFTKNTLKFCFHLINEILRLHVHLSGVHESGRDDDDFSGSGVSQLFQKKIRQKKMT